MRLDQWEKQQLKKAVNDSIKATRTQMNHLRTVGKIHQLGPLKDRLLKFMKLQEKIQKLG